MAVYSACDLDPPAAATPAVSPPPPATVPVTTATSAMIAASPRRLMASRTIPIRVAQNEPLPPSHPGTVAVDAIILIGAARSHVIWRCTRFPVPAAHIAVRVHSSSPSLEPELIRTQPVVAREATAAAVNLALSRRLWEHHLEFVVLVGGGSEPAVQLTRP